MDWLRNLTAADETPLAKGEPEDNELIPEDDAFLLNRINLSGAPSSKDDTPKQTPAFSITEEQEEEGNADWLRVLEESSTRKETAAHTLPEADNSDLDAWLENLSSSSTPPPAEPQPETSARQTLSKKLTERLKEEALAHEEPKQGDWMNTLREKSTDETAPKANENTDSASVFTSSSVDRTGSLLGWLDDETPFSDDLNVAENAELPDWLNEETPSQEGSAPVPPDLSLPEDPPAQAADLPDWLRDMAPPATASSTPFRAEPLVSAGHDDLPDWLQDETADTAAGMLDFSSGDGDDLSDLLSDFHTEETPAAQPPAAPVNDIFALNPEEKPGSPFPFGGDVPIEKDDSFEEEVLIGVPSPFDEEVPAEKRSIHIPTGNGEELPDWLKEESPAAEAAPFAASPFTEEPSASSSTPFEDDADLPDWLAEESPAAEAAPVAASPFTDELASSSAAPFEDDTDLPDWLAEESPVAEAAPVAASPFTDEPASASSAASFEDDADLPDWLASEPSSTEEGSTEEETPAANVPAFSASPFLDNLASKDGDSFGDSATFENENLFGDVAPDNDAPPVRAERSADAFEPAPAGDEHPFAADNLPDWLESEEASQIMPEQTGTGDAAENLSPAQLPGWLAAMRPGRIGSH